MGRGNPAPTILRPRRVVALTRAEAEVGSPRHAHIDSPESPVGALGGRVVAEQVLRSQIGRDLSERLV
jgi:hypothetical protein